MKLAITLRTEVIRLAQFKCHFKFSSTKIINDISARFLNNTFKFEDLPTACWDLIDKIPCE